METENTPTFCIISQEDPLGNRVGGIISYIRYLIEFFPAKYHLEMIGVSSDLKKRPIKKWTQCKLGKRPFAFYPLFFKKNENKKDLIPLSLRFTLALKRQKKELQNKVLLFHRIEHTLPFPNHPKAIVVHYNVTEMVLTKQHEHLLKKWPIILNTIEKRSFKNCHKIFSINKKNLSYYKDRYPDMAKCFAFIPTSYNPNIFQLKQHSPVHYKQKISPNIPNPINLKLPWILYSGRLDPIKAPHRLIEVAKQLTMSNVSFQLLIAGEGKLKKQLADEVDKDTELKKNCFLLGQKTPSEVALLLQASEVSILTSHSEGMPISLLESLACGTPVVSTKVGAVEEFLIPETNGEINEPYDPKTFALKVKQILKRKERYSPSICHSSVKKYHPSQAFQLIYQSLKEIWKSKLSSQDRSI